MSEDGASGLPLWEAARAMGISVSEEVGPQDREVRANGLRLHYLDWGNEGRPTLVLLHGGMQTAHSWDFVALALRDTYHVLALDQRGHGDSDWAPDKDYTLETQVRDLEEFLDTLRLDTVTLVGLSMGGRNSFVYAARHPDRVRALVVVDIAPASRREGQEHIRRFTSSFPDELPSFDEFAQRVHAFNPRRPIEQLRGSLRHNLRRLPNGNWTWKYDRVFRDPRREGGGWKSDHLWALLGNIRCPTLLVRGAESDVVDQEIMERMERLIPRASLASVPRAGHLVMGDNPAGFVQVVRAFLDSLE